MSDALTPIVVAILSGGLVGGIASFVTGRALARKTLAEASAIDKKTPIEVDNIVVAGAEQAVLLMDRALQSAKTRIKDLETERAVEQVKIAALEEKIAALEAKATAAEQAAKAARVELTEVRDQLTTMVRENGNRR